MRDSVPHRSVAGKSSVGGFMFVQGGLTYYNLIKAPLIHSVSYFNWGGAWSFVCGV